ncbi:hypothetical protein [Deinococcus altitudinis]|uniref:hypothetical protein n=1 Tax=Deinococcus altitudinis TaxID=468914 RepID=UPI003892AF7B
MTGRLARLRRLEARQPAPEGVRVMIVQTIVDKGPDGGRVVRKEFTVYPAGAK